MTPTTQILQGDCRDVLPSLPAESVQCCVTSPPYWALRDYGVEGQIGMEPTPQAFIDQMVKVFTEVHRILKNDGTLWVNIGDTYNFGKTRTDRSLHAGRDGLFAESDRLSRKRDASLKQKDLVGIPWMLAFALRDRVGFHLRCDIIWHKPNPTPESVTDRPTKSHEYLFLFSKQEQYYYDYEAIKEPPSAALLKQIADGYNGSSTKDFSSSRAQDASATKARIINNAREKISKHRGHVRPHDGITQFTREWDNLSAEEKLVIGRNKRSVWTVSTRPYSDAHFATYPPELIAPCIHAGTRPGDTVLDPFGGSGTTGEVAIACGRNAILIEINPSYIPLITQRTKQPGLAL